MRLAVIVIPQDTSTTKKGTEGKAKRYAFSTSIDVNDNTPIEAGGAPNRITERAQPSNCPVL